MEDEEEEKRADKSMHPGFSAIKIQKKKYYKNVFLTFIYNQRWFEVYSQRINEQYFT